MITRMSENIASAFVLHGVIHEDDREVYSYSLELLFSTLFSLLFVAIVATLTGTLIYSALFLIGFMPLRVIAGGYHAKNHFRCFMILVFAYSVFLLLLAYMPTAHIFPAILAGTAMSIIFVFLLSPSEDNNKPLSDNQIVRLKKSSRVAVMVYAVSIFALTLALSDIRFAFALSLGVIVVGLSLLANFAKYKINKILKEGSGRNE